MSEPRTTPCAVACALACALALLLPAAAPCRAQDGADVSPVTTSTEADWTPPTPGVTVRVSVDGGGEQLADGAYVGAISADGSCVVFGAVLPEVLAGPRSRDWRLWVRGLDTGSLDILPATIEGRRVSTQHAAVSADGGLVAFTTLQGSDPRALGHGGVMVVDREGKVLSIVDGERAGVAAPVSTKPFAFSADGGTLVVQTTADFQAGIKRATARLLDVKADSVFELPCGAAGLWVVDAAVSADGRRMVVAHLDMKHADPRSSGPYVLDRDTCKVEPLAGRNGPITMGVVSPSMSADGRWVVLATHLDAGIEVDDNGVRDVFRFDTQQGTVDIVSVTPDGGVSKTSSETWPGRSVSDDGRFVAFASDAADLVPGDGNDLRDLFVRDMERGRTVRVSVARDGGDADGKSGWPSLSGDGRRIVFTSEATNLVEGDTNGSTDVFVRELTWDD